MRNPALAAHWLEKAAELHQPRALYKLAAFHATGTGYPQSWDKALEYYKLAAELGNAPGRDEPRTHAPDRRGRRGRPRRSGPLA
ncbi:MAG: hypothetical protein AB7L28_18245 [Kofleriaceae bacterium]